MGKFGLFPANALLGRPYYLTFELVDSKMPTELRIVPAAELHADALIAESPLSTEPAGEPVAEDDDGGAEIEAVAVDSLMRDNRLTIDDPARQALTMADIEALKRADSGSTGKDIIARLLASHQALDEKTEFALAKYTLRKSRKYLKHLTLLPLDVGLLTAYLAEKDPYKILELRDEILGMIVCWANVHCAAADRIFRTDDGRCQIGGGRWLVLDDTGGLVVAALAEKMGILYPRESEDSGEDDAHHQPTGPAPRRASPLQPLAMSAKTNTLTVVHSNTQPNLSLLKYFSFDATLPNSTPNHPLHTHLKSLSWLSLLQPESDPCYSEPPVQSPGELAAQKSSKRSAYWKKRRRWERTKRIVDETRGGGFDGLVVAGFMEPVSVMRALVPLMRGGGQVVVYSPHVEPLVELCDLYSKERRAAFLESKQHAHGPISLDSEKLHEAAHAASDSADLFPLDPMLLLSPALHTTRAEQWQIHPGRTHSVMVSPGGAEGYLFTATRVVPAEGRVEGRGLRKRRKVCAD